MKSLISDNYEWEGWVTTTTQQYQLLGRDAEEKLDAALSALVHSSLLTLQEPKED